MDRVRFDPQRHLGEIAGGPAMHHPPAAADVEQALVAVAGSETSRLHIDRVEPDGTPHVWAQRGERDDRSIGTLPVGGFRWVQFGDEASSDSRQVELDRSRIELLERGDAHIVSSGVTGCASGGQHSRARNGRALEEGSSRNRA